ncbi:hypothetical protein GT022_17670 [Agaribacter marinus]|uniref:Uncharacterized protein n=1 Tax=Virgibacillus salarius TaxID=447199 RepID=A0A941DYT2_9BACI|nr:hypothetical protein [Virgibacillus salarius]MBR7797861.1 hypothetical protein [Virgibacillus salarius]NAZ10571.1 hypothetical protein [Agaribacter marinus]WBX81096.1 hypothetical protein PD280_04810 [Virgibacillus salarius]
MAISTPTLKLVKPEITDEIGTSIANFAQNADKIDSAIKQLQEDNLALQGDVTKNKMDLEAMNDSISSLQTNFNTISSVVEENKITIETMQTQLANIEERLTALETVSTEGEA